MAHSRSFSFDEAPLSSSEQEALYQNHSPESSHNHPYHDSPPESSHVSPSWLFSSAPQESSGASPPSPSTRRYHPSAHPNSSFSPARRVPNISLDSARHRRSSSSQSSRHQDYLQPPPPPPPSHHRETAGPSSSGHFAGHHQAYALTAQTSRPSSSFTDGMGEFDEGQPGGRVDRVDTNLAKAAQADGGMQPFPSLEPSSSGRGCAPVDQKHPSARPDPASLPQRPAEASQHLRQRGSYSSSTIPIAAAAATPGSNTPNLPPLDGPGQSFALADYQSRPNPAALYSYQDSPYQNSSLNFVPQISQADINPQNIADDGDDGFIPVPKRRSVLGIGGTSGNDDGTSPSPAAAPGGVAAAAAAGGIMGALSGLAGRKQKAPTSSGAYDPVGQPESVDHGGGGGFRATEKSEWLSRQTRGNNRMRWVVGLVIGLVVVLAIVGGVVGGVLGTKSAGRSNRGGGTSPGDSVNNANDDTVTNGDLDKDSAEIKSLMNNADLHKVFPAMDYTPWGTQYPLCLTYPPSQNNITRDLAVLSQLTNTVRLYGTDCNQTEMVLHSIDRLGLTSMKVWLGVWIETNTTTNERQLEQMYKILEETSDLAVFKGVIIGNEALYRAGLNKAASQEDLIEILTEVKSNFTSLHYDLPVTTSDLGDNWNTALVQAVDVVMSNIHPFFAGVDADEAAGWTWNFWQTKNTPLTQGTDKPQIISETGWPSGGGNDCGLAECASSTSGSVAGIDEMNTFMADFVCQAMDNGTDYFWFEAFDEPWKVVYNTPGEEWEDKWGLMDPARKLKPGLKIPDCGGRTVS